MCGLTCVFHPGTARIPSVDDVKSGLEASLELIKHRGPDSRGIWISPDARVGLGHVRLSIIDLCSGQQPMSDEDELIHCVVTGEIYDHDRIRDEMERQGFTFKSKSDSELVVQLYKRDGINCVVNLRGEFAFVLYDTKRRQIFAARDRFGIKPLYYTVSNGRILFASEMKAFMGLGWKAEWDLDSIVHSGDIGDDRTVFRGVKKLSAGHFAICAASGYIRTERYWDLSYPAAAAPAPSSVESMISTVQKHLVDAVRLRLRSDVPLAVYLSGGIDSAAVAGIATHLLRETNPNAKLTAFTLAYPEDDRTDESPMAARTAAHLGADLNLVNATEETLVGALEDAIWHSEQPNTTFHGAGKILLSRAVRNSGYKVVLTGEGSDDIFGGYGWLTLDYLRDSDPAAVGLGFALPTESERLGMLAKLEASAGIPEYSTSVVSVKDSKLLKISTHHVMTTLTAFYRPMFSAKVLELTGGPEIAQCMAEGVNALVRQHSVSGYWHSLNIASYVTAKCFLGQLILNQASDRNDMKNAIESRPSFLDHHLVEYVNTLPPSVKIMPVKGDGPGEWNLTEKWVLRQAVKPFVTEEMYLRKKVSFNPPPRPSSSSGLAPLQALLSARITQTNVERLGFFDWAYIRDILGEYINSPGFSAQGAIDHRARMLMGVLSFIVLQERFNVPSLNL